MVKELNGVNSLKNKVAIYVPSTIDVYKSIDNTQYVNEVAKELCLLFGGATSQNAVGSWYSNELNKLVTENVTIVYSFISDDDYTEENLTKVVSIAKKLCKDMSQECISLEVNNNLNFISC